MTGLEAAASVVGMALFASVRRRILRTARRRPIDPELLVVREAAWRAFFGGDVKTLGELLPQEFIGIT